MKQIQIKEYPKNTISKDKSKNFHPKDLLKPVLTKKQRIIDFIKKTIKEKGYCSYSQSSIAEMLNCSRDYVGDVYAQLKDDPTFTITSKTYFTCIIYFSCLISSLLSGNPALINSLKRSNSYISYNSNTKKSEYMSNEQRYASVVTNLNKIHKNEEIQPDYSDWVKKKPIASAKPFEKPQQGEMSKPSSPKKLFPKALVGKAKRIWEEAQKKPYSLFKAKRELAEFKQYYPEGIEEFTHWYNSQEGIGFKKWITQ